MKRPNKPYGLSLASTISLVWCSLVRPGVKHRGLHLKGSSLTCKHNTRLEELSRNLFGFILKNKSLMKLTPGQAWVLPKFQTVLPLSTSAIFLGPFLKHPAANIIKLFTVVSYEFL
jgi:hypothetical protein